MVCSFPARGGGFSGWVEQRDVNRSAKTVRPIPWVITKESADKTRLAGLFSFKVLGCPRKLGSMVRINGL